MRHRTVWPNRTLALLAATLAAFTLLVSLVPSTARAQENSECLECHGDAQKTSAREGEAVPPWVDGKHYGEAVHSRLECIICHFDLEETEYPHETGTEIMHCSECHEEQAETHADTVHGQALENGDELAPECWDCHTAHEVFPASDPRSRAFVMNIPMMCGRCHHEGTEVSIQHDIPQERIFENYSQSIHGEGLYKQGLVVTAVCTSCHTSHSIYKHEDVRSSIHHDNVAKTCTKCHAQIEAVHRKVIDGELWEKEPHKIPSCVDCHSPHEIRNVFYPSGMANQDCLKCHGDKSLFVNRGGKAVSLFVDERDYARSTHSGTACAQCHSDATVSLERPCETIQSKVDCSVCHAEQVSDYQASTHGQLHAAGDPDAPACLDCHDNHATQSKRTPTSPTFPRNVADLCGSCHREGGTAERRIHGGEGPDVVGMYEESIHGRGIVESGLTVTATCASCHTPHRELPPEDPASSVHHDNVADTCGQCHHGIEEKFRRSIHWPGNGTATEGLPSCKDCHSSHTIARAGTAGFRAMMMDQCGRCHEQEAESFFDTFHGKVSRLGLESAATCYDCHGTHEILPPSDMASTLSRENVVETCAQCHEGAHRQFAGYLTHATHHDRESYPWLFWTFWIMTTLLVGTLSFFLVHTMAWLFRLWLSRDEWRAHRAAAHAAKGQKLYRRFNRYQRSLHMSMMLSFFTLAITGMSLKFSYTGWAQWLSKVLGGFQVMSILHRIAAIVLIIVFVVHVTRMLMDKRKSGMTWKQVLTGPRTLMFTIEDVKQFFQSVRWFFGLGPRPHFGRWTYWEKFDYFAVFWGVFVIGSTGFLLWFPELFTHIVPGWFVNVATIIHSDEALLAVAFIFTIHFFNTHFRPDKFPMDPVIFTGRVPLDELKYDKPGEYELMVATGELEERMVEPMSPGLERGFRIFGFFALFVGLTLIGLIIYAMVFAYR